MTSVFMAVLVAVAASAEPTDADWQWVADHREAALEYFMPLRRAPHKYVGYRSYRDLYQDVREQYLAISGTRDHPTAVAVVPEGRSIQDQLLALHMADRAAPLSSLLARVQIRRHHVVAASCPAVKEHLEDLILMANRLPKPDDVIVLHPTIHRFVLDFGAGAEDLRLIDDDYPLVRWAQRTVKAVLGCPTVPQAEV